MPMFRRTADRVIDDAHNHIADAEMRLAHSYTDEDRAEAEQRLSAAQRYLARAIAARDAWDAAGHTDEEVYPYVQKPGWPL